MFYLQLLHVPNPNYLIITVTNEFFSIWKIFSIQRFRQILLFYIILYKNSYKFIIFFLINLFFIDLPLITFLK
jgi:hypothetical protein